MKRDRILYVEDDDDIRETMTLLLEAEGYDVTAARDAERALAHLAAERFHLVLTDYRLPTESAGWLLKTAAERGYLGSTPAIVLSAEDRPADIEPHRFLRKPVSQEALLAAFAAAMPARDAGAMAPRTTAELRLTLYVSGASQASRKAERNLDRALEGVDPAQIELIVHDLMVGDTWVQAAEDDRIVVLPTLVRRAPLPKVWIAGDLSDVERVREAILPASLVRDVR